MKNQITTILACSLFILLTSQSSAQSDVLSANPEIPAAIEETDNDSYESNSNDLEKTSIYPIPASSELNININSSTPEHVEMSILNMSGHIVKRFMINDTNSIIKVDIDNLPIGQYIVMLNDNNQKYSQNIIKQ